MGIRTDLLVTEEIAESSDLRATPYESEKAKRVEGALPILEGKWKIVILNRLFARPIWRFSELERAVPGISQAMLSQQLRLLEKCELVKRTVHPQFPQRRTLPHGLRSTSRRLVGIQAGRYTGLAMNITVVAGASDTLFLSKYPAIICLQLKSHRCA